MRIKKYKSLLFFLFIFYFCMGLSKFAQVLWFEKSGNLVNYSLSYSAMAIAGAFSFLLSNWISKLTLKVAMRIFIPIYVIGMLLRTITGPSLIPIISGVISGIGAATVLLIVRTWIYKLTDEAVEDKSFIVSSRYTVMQISLTLATLCAGLFLSLYNDSSIAYLSILVISSLLLFITLLVRNFPTQKVFKKDKLFTLFPTDKKIAIILYGCVILLGVSISLVEPLLPVIVSDLGYSTSITSLIISGYGLIKIGASFIFQHKLFSARPQITFLICELIIGGLFIATGLVNVDSILIISFIYILSIGTAGFFILKEIMEYEMLPKKELAIYLGLLQSAFLIGDSIGSPIGASIYSYFGYPMLFIVFGIVASLGGIVYFSLYYWMKRKWTQHLNEG
ncbi:MFS transporter [Listeria seeligeri]|uniref:MFS transporter n=2 Tax=Listeria seeligeri TaxID=1640 RepID=A0A7T0MAT5_LISSE|nr:MFS transporter [Listeria seeligeri]MBF2643030.1 MFS transporter [Listeria seeligeri]QPL19389.1 MFS transporter [Listeria seeligeri]